MHKAVTAKNEKCSNTDHHAGTTIYTFLSITHWVKVGQYTKKQMALERFFTIFWRDTFLTKEFCVFYFPSPYPMLTKTV